MYFGFCLYKYSIKYFEINFFPLSCNIIKKLTELCDILFKIKQFSKPVATLSEQFLNGANVLVD